MLDQRYIWGRYCRQILEVYAITLKLVTNESWRETQFKLMHKAYIPFSTEHSTPKEASCPWCSVSRPTLYHRQSMDMSAHFRILGSNPIFHPEIQKSFIQKLSEIKRDLKTLLFREKLDIILQNDWHNKSFETRWRSFIDICLTTFEVSSLQTPFVFTSRGGGPIQ